MTTNTTTTQPTLIRVKRPFHATIPSPSSSLTDNASLPPHTIFLDLNNNNTNNNTKRLKAILVHPNVDSQHLAESQTQTLATIRRARDRHVETSRHDRHGQFMDMRGLKPNTSNSIVDAVACNDVNLRRVDVLDAELDKALWDASALNNFGPILRLIRKGGRHPDSARTHSPDGATALTAACRHGNVTAVTELLEMGADPTVRDGYGFSPLDYLNQHCETTPEAFNYIKYALVHAMATRYVYDLYVVHDGDDDVGNGNSNGNGAPLYTPSLRQGAVVIDPMTNTLVELADPVGDSDDDKSQIGNEEDSDSNEEDYWQKRLPDEEMSEGDDDDNECVFGGGECEDDDDDDNDDDEVEGAY